MASISLQDAEKARLSITKEQEKEISELYHQVYKDYRKKLKSLPLKGEGTTSQSLQKLYLNQLTKQLKEAYTELDQKLETMVSGGMEQASQSVVDSVGNWQGEVGLKMEGLYSYVPQDIVSILSSGKLYGEGWTLSKATWGQNQKTLHDIDQVVAMGVAGNKSAYDIAKDLEKYVNPSAKKDWNWSKVYPGTSKKVDYNAQRLARTMVSHAYQQSLLATTKNNPFVTGYKWRSAHTHRTCKICNERDGQVYSAENLPLDHPNGMCTFLAELSGNMKDIADRLRDWANGAEDPALDKWASSMFPKSPEQFKLTPTQSEWLKKAGFSEEHMPQNFKEFANGLSFKQQSKLLKLAGGSWKDPHPYQIMEEWYKKNILVGPLSSSGKYSPKAAVKEAVKGTTKKTTKKASSSTGHNLTTSHINKLLNSQSTDVFKEQAKSWWTELSKAQRSGISSYTGKSYTWMNEALRNGTIDQLTNPRKEKIRAAQEALLQYSSEQDMVVRRGSKLNSLGSMLGVGDHSSDWYLAHRGEFIHSMAQDKGFLSTSPDPEGGFGGQVEYRIFVPKGSPAPYIDSYSQNRGEKETLLPPGSQHRVIDLQGENDKLVVYLELTGFSK